MKHFVVIQWGRDIAEAGLRRSYGFATVEELNAFMQGVAEASGWLDYMVIEDSRGT